MKKYSFLLLFLLSALGIQAQSSHWNAPAANVYSESHVVYAKLVSNEGSDRANYELAGFLGEECRGAAFYDEYIYGETAQIPVDTCYALRVRGGEADAGKEIIFKVYNVATGKEYTVTPAQTVNWTVGTTTGEASNPLILTLSIATDMSLPETISLKVGETVNLLELLTIEPEGAQLPTDLAWDLGNSTNVASIENHVLTAQQATSTSGVTLQLVDASGLVRASTTLIITNPATALAIKDEYKDGVTVFKNDAEELTRIINDCLIITPEDATDNVEWVIGDETIIARNPVAAASYTPIAGGQTTMTARILDDEGNVRLSAVLNVTVVVPVESITLDFNANSMLANVGDNVYARLPKVTVLPEDATNKEYTWSSNDSTIISVNGENMIALKEGFTDLFVTSADNPDATRSFRVNVINQAKTVDVAEQIINVVHQSEDLDISDLIKNNITFGPEGYSSIVANITSSDNTVVDVTKSSISGSDSININAFALKAGSATITVTLQYDDFNGQPATYYPGNTPNTTVTKTFTVNVTEGLTGFEINVAEAKKGEASAITITPVPENADIDVSKVTVEVNGLSEMPGEWTFATVASQGDGKNFTVTPNLPGMALVSVLYNDEVISQQEMEVGMPISLTSGWQWRSFPYATIEGGQLQTVFGNELEEIRSQDYLLYNDSQYGYFGTLLQNGMNSREGYKVKMKSSRDYTLTGVSLNLFGDEAALNPGWTWIFNPYFYDRRIADVLQGTFNTGDRIVSKDDGFAEYSGGRWTGTLTLLRAGQGYLYYNAGTEEIVLNFAPEAEMAQENAAAGAKQMGMRTEWNYDASAFDGNMNIVAQISAIPNMEDYVIGAYVGDECRGEGIPVDGKLFITVHGTAGERVNFIAHNEATNEFFPISETVTLQQNLGSVGNPFVMNIGGGATGIDSIRAEFLKGSKSWNLRGVEMPVNTPQKGVRIIRMADGKTVKTTK